MKIKRFNEEMEYKIVEIDSIYDFDRTSLQVEKEDGKKVRLTIKNWHTDVELDIVVDVDKLKANL